jgi:endo-1,4-beta-xylanase
MLDQFYINRRNALKVGIAGIAGLAASQAVRFGSQPSPSPAPVQTPDQENSLLIANRDFTVSGDDSLKVRAAKKGILFGTAADSYYLYRDTAYAEKVAHDCGLLVPESDLKWASLRPSPEEFNFERGDWLAEFADRHNMLFRGHTLVWDQGLPPWFESTVNSRNAERFLTEHINRVAQHYAGRLHSWDVVNEAINVKYSSRPDGLSSSPWMRFLGKDYIELAFRTTAAADPQALLVYNDAGFEYDIPEHNTKRDAVLSLLEHLQSVGAPIDALGIESHLWGHETRFNENQFRQFLQDVASMGLKILITELDVADNALPEDTEERDRRVAAAYEDYLSVVLDEPAVIAVITWGLSDRYTWRAAYGSKRPLPLDTNLNKKLAWNAIARAFDNAPYRTVET